MGKRSIKLDGKTTSLFLEDAFWRELEIRAEKHELNWTDYLRELIDELEPSSNRSAAIKEALVKKLRKDLEANLVSSHWLYEVNGISQRLSFSSTRLLIGSSKECDFFMDDDAVDTKHAILASDGNKWWLIDCNSKSGTYLNGRPIAAAAVPRQGEIKVGACQIKRI